MFQHKTEKAEYDFKILSINDRSQRASLEKSLFEANKSTSGATFVLSEKWLRHWQSFTDLYDSPPGSIDNLHLYKALVKEKRQLKEGEDYHLISRE